MVAIEGSQNLIAQPFSKMRIEQKYGFFDHGQTEQQESLT